MSFSVSAAAICFIACHGGPADHFSTFAEALVKKGYIVQLYATGPALQKFEQRKIEGVTPFSLEKVSEESAAIELARGCSEAAVVITDVGHRFDITLQTVLQREAPKCVRLAYYDNPEAYVPGGYSATAAKVITAAHGVLFANSHLAESRLHEAPDREVPLLPEKKMGIGYYPISQAARISEKRRSDQTRMKAAFFDQHSLKDQRQKVLVYTGGNNDEYFSKAFPAFLQFLGEASQRKDLSQFIVLLQQHPGAKESNLDGKQVLEWVKQYGQKEGTPRFLISQLSSDDAQVIADGILYYQTSMGPQFILAGIPTIQVGHNTYEDILVKNGLCSTATDPKGLLDALTLFHKEPEGTSNSDAIMEGLGIHSDWLTRLEKAIKDFQPN